MDFKAYHKIPQFKDVIKAISSSSNYKGKDESGNPIYVDSTKPTIKFTGTVKLHGTNALISYDGENMLPGKRSSLIGGFEGHFGFTEFIMSLNKDYFQRVCKNYYKDNCTSGEQINIYGEWAGEGIQKGVGIALGRKSFFIFGISVSTRNEENTRWLDITNDTFTCDRVYNINQFPTFSIDIDFNNPGLVQNKLVELTNQIEQECPVSKQLGYEGKLVGEGIVWTGFYNGNKYIFKVKGQEHSVSKTKTLAPVNEEVIKNVKEFVEYACTENRINQGIQETGAKTRADTGNLLRWLANDIITEEMAALDANSLEWKDVAAPIANKARKHFFDKIDTI